MESGSGLLELPMKYTAYFSKVGDLHFLPHGGSLFLVEVPVTNLATVFLEPPIAFGAKQMCFS